MVTTEVAARRDVRTQDRGGLLAAGIVLFGLAALVVLGMSALGASVVGFWGWDADVLHLSAGWALVPAVLATGGAACVRRATAQARPRLPVVLAGAWLASWIVMNAFMGTVA